MTKDDTVARARESFGRQAWGDAYAQLSAVDQLTPLGLDDLERLALAAFLIGKDAESAEVGARAHHESLRLDDPARAARCAFWVGFQHLNRGEVAQGLGWLARAGRVLDERHLDCVERGYLLLPTAIRSVDEEDYATAYTVFSNAAEIADRFADAELATMARYGRGRALIGSGRIADGVALIDEAMVGITSGQVSPSVVGALYCSAIEAWKGILDLERAQEWTAALSRWCESQPDLVAFRGPCLVFRAEIMQLRGAWPDAMEEALRAGERLSAPPGHPAAGAAFYQQAELHRLRGDLLKAEEAYRQASQLGRTPQPGLAQLRLAQGQIEAACVAMRRVMDEKHDRATRATMLAAYVEVLLAANDVPGARAAADELTRIVVEHHAPLLDAIRAQAKGAVLLAEGDARAALSELRLAWTAWRQLEAPYEAARVRVLTGLACRALKDEGGAEMEFDAARSVFLQLGATTDLARVEELSGTTKGVTSQGGLTSRELQVLVLVATGKTNRAIAAELVISEKTVARHVSNIYDKISVSSRAAATAYAYEHGLV
jgi:ATP/maltotriose-dependent transcriptional regulator MalT